MLFFILLMIFSGQTIIQDSNYSRSGYKHYYDSDTKAFYFTELSIDQKSQSIKLYRQLNNKLDTFNLEIPDKRKYSFTIHSLMVTKNYLFISSWNRCYFYKIIRNRDNKLSFEVYDYGKQGYSYDYLYYDENKLIALNCFYDGKNSPNGMYTSAFIYDVKSKEAKEVVLENPDGIIFTIFQPRKLITYQDNYIYTIDISGTNIRKYNLDGKFIETLTLNLPNRKTTFEKIDKSLPIKQTLNKYREKVYSSELVFNFSSINDSLFNISYYDERNEKIMFNNIILNKEFSIVDSFYTKEYKGKDKYNIQNPDFINNNFKIQDDVYVAISEEPLIIKDGETRDDYDKRVEKYILNNSLYYSYFIYKYK